MLHWDPFFASWHCVILFSVRDTKLAIEYDFVDWKKEQDFSRNMLIEFGQIKWKERMLHHIKLVVECEDKQGVYI